MSMVPITYALNHTDLSGGVGDFYQFKPNGISHSYQLDQSISVLSVVGWYFSFLIKNFKKIFCKQTVKS